jgi:hypothetical protein
VTDPRQLHVIGKKSEVADRTLNERKYCAIDDYYYSEMFTCPICFGADRERERVIKLLEEEKKDSWHDIRLFLDVLITLIREKSNAE